MFSKTGVKRVIDSQYLLHVLRKELGTGPHPVTLGPAGRAVPGGLLLGWDARPGRAEEPACPPVGAGGWHRVWGQSIITIFRMDPVLPGRSAGRQAAVGNG